MIYLIRVRDTIEIAACEDKRLADMRVDNGYRIVTYDEFRLAWQVRDIKALARQTNEPQPQPQERAVGDSTPPNVPVGYTFFRVKKGK